MTVMIPIHSFVLVSLFLLVATRGDSSSSAAIANKNVIKVVLVGGQSNCQGLGDKFQLNELVRTQPAEFAKYGQAAVNKEGLNLTTRNDAYVVIEPERSIYGPLYPKFGDTKKKFGIEVGMGWVLGDYYEENDVLIIKHCEVAELAEEWSAPNGTAFTSAVGTYRRYLSEPELVKVLPSYKNGTGYEVIAFVWFHGYADVYNAKFRAQYGSNLRNLLSSMNEHFQIQSNIIIQTGGGGEAPDSDEADLRNIQACVAEDSTTNNTALVETYMYAGGESIDDETMFHYQGRADNYIYIGEAVGNDIVALLNGNYTPTNICNGAGSTSQVTVVPCASTEAPVASATSGPTSRPTVAPFTQVPSNPPTSAPTENPTSNTNLQRTQAPSTKEPSRQPTRAQTISETNGSAPEPAQTPGLTGTSGSLPATVKYASLLGSLIAFFLR